MLRLEMKNCNTTLRENAKISALSWGKFDKYGYFPDEEVLLQDQSIIIKKDTFTNYPLLKVFEKQTKKIENQEKKQTETWEVWRPVKLKLANKDAILKDQWRFWCGVIPLKLTESTANPGMLARIAASIQILSTLNY